MGMGIVEPEAKVRRLVEQEAVLEDAGDGDYVTCSPHSERVSDLVTRNKYHKWYRSDEASKKAEGRQYFITKYSGAGATAS